MNTTNKLLTISLLCALPWASQAQFNYANSFWEAGIAAGVSSYGGELTTSVLDYKHMHLALGGFVRFHPNKFVGIRLQGMYGSISGNDKDSKNQVDQVRNLNFKSNIFEVGVMGDFYLLGFNPEKQRMFSPYVSIGLSVFNFNPKGKAFDPQALLDTDKQNDWIALQPLHTEGQNSMPNKRAYARTQVAVPLALGIQYAVHSHLNLGLELGYRVTFTDYLDDVGLSYPIDVINDSSYYSATPYRAGAFDGKSQQEIMSDRTYEYYVNQIGAQMGDNVLTSQQAKDDYARLQASRGGVQRGKKGNDSYLFMTLTISYNFIDNGLVGARHRRKKKSGCATGNF